MKYKVPRYPPKNFYREQPPGGWAAVGFVIKTSVASKTLEPQKSDAWEHDCLVAWYANHFCLRHEAGSAASRKWHQPMGGTQSYDQTLLHSRASIIARHQTTYAAPSVRQLTAPRDFKTAKVCTDRFNLFRLPISNLSAFSDAVAPDCEGVALRCRSTAPSNATPNFHARGHGRPEDTGGKIPIFRLPESDGR